jgi:hypothetical protein
LGTRPLLPGETRAGGRPWNVLKHCAVIWTISLPVFLVYGAFSSAVHISFLRTELERAGGIAGMLIGLAIEVSVWLCGLAVALLLGSYLRKPDLVEVGSVRPERALAPAVEKPAGREPL